MRRLTALGVDALHFDIMDAHFTPNMPLGLEILKQLRQRTELPFDVHLMVDDNDLFLSEVLPIGVDRVSVHVESAIHLDRVLALIREAGVKAGAALNPATPLDRLSCVLDKLDFVLIMTVDPGFAGQKLVASALGKIRDCKAFLQERGFQIPIQVDGNVSFQNTPEMVASGADMLVCGTSSLFGQDAPLPENMARLRECIALGLRMRVG